MAGVRSIAIHTELLPRPPPDTVSGSGGWPATTASTLDAANAAAGNSAVAYCSQRFRSYDPVSGTYLGYDGYRHPCP